MPAGARSPAGAGCNTLPTQAYKPWRSAHASTTRLSSCSSGHLGKHREHRGRRRPPAGSPRRPWMDVLRRPRPRRALCTARQDLGAPDPGADASALLVLHDRSNGDRCGIQRHRDDPAGIRLSRPALSAREPRPVEGPRHRAGLPPPIAALAPIRPETSGRRSFPAAVWHPVDRCDTGARYSPRHIGGAP